MISPTNIGSGAESPLPGAWVLLAEYLRPGLALWHLPLQLLHPMLVTVCGATTSLCSPTSPRTIRNRGNASEKQGGRDQPSGIPDGKVEHMVDKAPEDETGFDQVLVQLDKRFKYDDCVEMPWAPEKMEKFLHGSTRRGDQSLMQYCADHREARRELKKHKINLPYTASGWLLLRRPSLTYEQRQMVQTQCASLEEVKVEEAMYYLFGQDYQGRSDVRWGANAQAAKLHQRWPPRQHAYAAEEAREMDDDGLWRRTPTRTSAKTEDAFYSEEAMDQEYDTTREGHGADDNAEETYYTSLMSCVATMMKRWKSLLGRKAPTRQSSCCPKVLARCDTCS